MFTLTSLDATVSVDLLPMGERSYQWVENTRVRTYLYGDQTAESVPLGAEPPRLVVSGEYLLENADGEAARQALRGLLLQQVRVMQATTLLGTGAIHSLRTPQVRIRDQREAPIQRWELTVEFNAPVLAAPGVYVPEPPPPPDPVPPGEPPP